jgi:hypothetical protein
VRLYVSLGIMNHLVVEGTHVDYLIRVNRENA